jgi:thioredoxin reductase (NADPH)
MFDSDVVIIGGGPAGLAAGIYLSRAKRRTLILERDLFGGNLKNVEWIENYPGYADGVAGPLLATEMEKQAEKYGAQLKLAEVTGIELFSSSRWVACANGQGFTTAIVIVAGGTRPKRLGVPGEVALEGKGVFTCALCDGGNFLDRAVVVCGSGDSALTEALYMSKLASKVVLLARSPVLRATSILQERALANPKIQVLTGAKVEAIVGSNQVEGIEFTNTETGERGTLHVDGVLVRVGIEPNTNFLEGIVDLDERGQVVVNERMETVARYILAAGDIRSGSPRQVATAVGDGVTAAIRAERILEEIE